MAKTKKYRPSSGSEGLDFMNMFCVNCEIGEQEPLGYHACQIIADSMAFEKHDENYPQEWVCDEDGANPRCTKFKEVQK